MASGEKKLENKIEFSTLFSFYSPLLTKKQNDVARLHLEEDLSIIEIANYISTSKQAVSDTLLKCQIRFEELESKLRLVSKFININQNIDNLELILCRLKAKYKGEEDIVVALDVLSKIKEEEEA